MMYQDFFNSKEESGTILLEDLSKEKINNPFLLAIPRGGIQVSKAIADFYKIPINVIISKKLPLPMNPEVAFGAMTEDEIEILNENMLQDFSIDKTQLDKIVENVNKEIKHRIKKFGRYNPDEIKNTQVLLVDDGVATGSSLIAAIQKVKKMKPKEIIAITPACTRSAYDKISKIVDKFIAHIIDDSPFFAVSTFYKNWQDLSEEEIINILNTYRNKYSK